MLLALLLVAAPLVLLAHLSFNTHSRCDGMCCRRQKSRSTLTPPVSRASQESMLSCRRGIAGHLAMCIVPSSPHDNQETVAPLPPAILVELDAMDVLQWTDEARWNKFLLARPGFAPIPFEPPRS